MRFQQFMATHFPVWGLLLAATLNSHAHETAIVFVANNGADNPSCGSKAKPCRSIGRAIQEASDGDTIVVAPGRYGDSNDDGDFLDPGDEFFDPTSSSSACLVCVNKSVRLWSTRGSDVTIIDGAGTAPLGPVVGVDIFSSGASFGAKDHGFTVRAMSDVGILVSPQAGDVSVVGNHAANNGGMGFMIWVGPGLTRLRGNVATDNNFYGFFVASASPGSARVVENIARGNESFGFVIAGGTGPAYTVLRNVATSNASGFSIDGVGHRVRQNVAMNNMGGFIIVGSSKDLKLELNTAVGNLGAGIFIGPNVPGPIDIHRNNIYGSFGVSSSSERNCGITNQSGRTIDARDNFWGLSSGPGPDPADQAGPQMQPEPLCDAEVGSKTLVVPFSKVPFPIQPIAPEKKE